METRLTRHTTKKGVWTFRSGEDLHELFSIGENCLHKSECKKNLGKKKRDCIKEYTKDFLEAGFPSDTADSCLRRLAVHCICTNKGNTFIIDHDGFRETQHSRLYYEWLGLLWAEYHKAHPQNPPPLQLSERWRIDLPPQRTAEASQSQKIAHTSQNADIDTAPRRLLRRSATLLSFSTFDSSRREGLLKRLLPLGQRDKPNRPGFDRRHADRNIPTTGAAPFLDTSTGSDVSQNANSNEASKPADSEPHLVDKMSTRATAPATSTPLRSKEPRHPDDVFNGDPEPKDPNDTPLSSRSPLPNPVFTPEQSKVGTPPSDISSKSFPRDVPAPESPLAKMATRQRPAVKGGHLTPDKTPNGSARNETDLLAVKGEGTKRPDLKLDADIKKTLEGPDGFKGRSIAALVPEPVPVTDTNLPGVTVASLPQPDSNLSDDIYKIHPKEPPDFDGVVLFCTAGDDTRAKFHFLKELCSKTGIKTICVESEPEASSADATAASLTFKRTSIKPHVALGNLLNMLQFPKSRAACCIYGYTVPGADGYIKIGRSVDVNERLAAWEACCHLQPRLLFKTKVNSEVPGLEKIVHYYLNESRRYHTGCKNTKRGHHEWFELSVENALAAITTVKRFGNCKPYTASGHLTTFWYRQLAEAQGMLFRKELDQKLWVERWDAALEEAVKIPSEREPLLAEINLVVRVKNDGVLSRVEVVEQTETSERLLRDILIETERLRAGGKD